MEDRAYAGWLRQARPDERGMRLLRHRAESMQFRPLLSVLFPVADEDEIWIKHGAASVLDQIYADLELCICDNASVRPHVREVLDRISVGDARVKKIRLPEVAPRPRALDAALDLAEGEYVAVVDPGDELEPEALLLAAELLNASGADLVYADEDEIDLSGHPRNPIFKLPPGGDYPGRLSFFRRDIVESAGGFGGGDGTGERDLARRFSALSLKAVHLPGVMYHRRVLPGDPGAEEVGSGSTNAGLSPLREASVSVVVSAEEQHDEAFRQSLVESAGYSVGELIAADGESARALNAAARRATGEYVVFVGRGVRSFGSGWLASLLREAQRPGIGIVGGVLLDESGHAKMPLESLGFEGLTGEPRGGKVRDFPETPVSFPAPARFMAVRRSLFEAVGGFDEDNLPGAFYDLDLCFRLWEKGLSSVRVPLASAVVAGEPSSGSVEEVSYMWSRWWERLVWTLYYGGSPASCDREELETARSAVLYAASS